jgi:transglutaminase-like putative cysteine protease
MTLNRRMTVTTAVACVLVSTVMYPLFDFVAWFYAGIGAAAVVAVCGALSRLRVLPVLVCLAISLAGLLYYLTVLFEARYCLLRILPTPTSLSMLWHLAGTGITDAHLKTPPAPQLPGLVLLATSGIGITAVLTDLIASRLRSTALAGLPLLVLFTVPVTMDAPSGAGTVIVFSLGTAGYLAMLSADGRERIRVWGRLVSLWRSGPPHDVRGYRGTDPEGRTGPSASRGLGTGPDTRALAAAGRRVGLASAVLALCVPLIVPGLHPSRPFSTGTGTGTGVAGPGTATALPGVLAETLTNLREAHPTGVLAYTTTASPALEAQDEQYLQQSVLDYLSDSGWQVTSYYTAAVPATTIPPPPGLTVYSAARPVTTAVTSVARGQLSSPSAPTFLPMPYPPTKVSGLPGEWLADPELMVYSATDSATVGSYLVNSFAVDPTAAELNAAPPPPVASMSGDLQLPASYRIPALEHLAESITADAHAHTELEKAQALQDWLSGSRFTYDEAGKLFDSAQGLLNYLDTTRIGVCVQSAYAMTVLARLLNIPARMAQGYTAGTAVGKYSYVVKSSDSHVWPEIYFTGYGWLRFEPTPSGQGTAHAPNYAGTPTGSGHLATPPQGSTTPAGGKGTTTPGRPRGLRPNLGGGGQVTGQARKSTGGGWAAIVLAILAAIALACGVIAIVAPPAHRALSAHAEQAPRRGPATIVAMAALAAAAAAVVLLALYRVLSHAGFDLRAGWATVGIAFAAAGAAMLVAPAAGRILLRRWRWGRARDDVGRAHAAWREFRDDLADLGVGARPSEPPRTLAHRVTAGLPEPAREAVLRLALAEERASYAARPGDSADLRRSGAAARRGLAASVRPGARWRALIFPASVLTAAADGVAAITDQVGTLISRRATERRQLS